MALTNLQCDHAVCPRGKARVRITDEHGLFLQVTAAGQKYWRMKYRFAGKEKGIAFGVYPEVSLAEAREQQPRGRGHAADGTAATAPPNLPRARYPTPQPTR